MAGLRATWNTNPVNQHGLFARPAGSFLDMAHDVDQPLDQVVQTNVAQLFPATPLFSWQPRASVAYKVSDKMALHAGGGVFNDIYSGADGGPGRDESAVCAGFRGRDQRAGGRRGDCAGGAGQRGGCDGAGESGVSRSLLRAARLCRCEWGSAICPLAVNLNTFPSGTLKTPYFLQWSLGVERELGARGSLRVDYVGTRAVHEPYQVQLNGYQTVCKGCFAPFAYKQPLDPRFGSVNEFRTDAGSHYAGLQTSATKQLQGLTVRGNYTYSHCLDEVSNGGLLPFSTLGILSPLPGNLRREYGNCDYDVRHNLSAFAIYEIPFHSRQPLLQRVLGGWQVSETAFLHSGLPFSVLSAPYTANNNGIFQGSGPQYANRVPGVPLYRKTAVSGVTQTGSCSGSTRTRLPRWSILARGHVRWRFACDLPVWRLGPQQLPRAALHLLRGVCDEEDSDHGTCNLPLRYADIQCLQPPEFCAPQPTRRARLASRRRRRALAR